MAPVNRAHAVLATSSGHRTKSRVPERPTSRLKGLNSPAIALFHIARFGYISTPTKAEGPVGLLLIRRESCRTKGGMRIVTTVSAMQRLALGWRREGKTVGFVPTMGYLHDGHLSLIRKARQIVKPEGVVVASIFVNPAQFAATEDLSNYPRDLQRDKELCKDANIDVLFIPDSEQIYPSINSQYSTWVVEELVSKGMEGASRPTHFRGVTTIVAKLFNLVLPDVAIFGAKDFQQAAVVQKMVQDLNFPVKVVVAATVREKDNLAMSSRNKYLSPDERAQAPILYKAIQKAKETLKKTPGAIVTAKLKKELCDMIHTQPCAKVDYIEFFDPLSLDPLEELRPGCHMALAVHIGKTRLIDNALI
jgi:pantoate--beta-alanine ligase